MFYAEDKYQSEIVHACENALIDYFGFSSIPDENKLWECLKDYGEPPNIQNEYAKMIFEEYIFHACEEWEAAKEDFDYVANGFFDTHLYYQNEAVDNPSELYQKISDKFNELTPQLEEPER